MSAAVMRSIILSIWIGLTCRQSSAGKSCRVRTSIGVSAKMASNKEAISFEGRRLDIWRLNS